MKIWNSSAAALCVLAIGAAIAGCGGSSKKSASVVAATTPTTATTPATTSTAAKPPSTQTSKQSTTPAKTTTTPAKSPATQSQPKPKAKPANFGKLKLSSAAFKSGGPIEAKYTCEGAGISPPLQWHGVPTGTAQLLLLALDLTGAGGDTIQWALAIPANATGLPAGSLPAGTVVGNNSAGKAAWAGMCGAKGQLQHVAFLFYALRRKLNLRSGFDPIGVQRSLKGATLATGLAVATYKRP